MQDDMNDESLPYTTPFGSARSSEVSDVSLSSRDFARNSYNLPLWLCTGRGTLWTPEDSCGLTSSKQSLVQYFLWRKYLGIRRGIR